MKKIFLFLTFILFAGTTFSQTWETVQIDSAVSVKLPKGFTKTEADKKYSLYAVSPFGTILIFKAYDNPKTTPDIEKDRHLKKYYEDYVRDIKRSSTDAIIKDEKDGKLGELKVKDFTLQTDSGSGVVYRDFRILHANSATYTFEFLYQDIHKEYALPERERFFSSIEVNENLVKSDQYTTESFESATRDNSRIYQIGGLVLLILIILVILFLRKRKRQA